MSRYDWPRATRAKGARRGRATARRAFNLDRNAGASPETLFEARAHRHSSADAPLDAVEQPDGPGAPLGAAPTADRDLWMPAGPFGTLRGQADSDPRVAGRVRDIAVSADGQRAYAATALGGLWYSDTAGARWEPVGPWAMVTNRADLAASSHTLTCGAIHVRFSATGDPAGDEVWLGTGEPGSGRQSPFDLGTGGQYAGVGMLHATGPVATSRTTPLVDPWGREAQPRPAAGATPAYQGLRGAGIYRLVADPANSRNLVAATSRGLHQNGSGLIPDPWAQVVVAAWEGLAAGASATAVVTDAAWTPASGAHPARLWVAVVDLNTPALTDVWVSANGVAGPFTPVGLPNVVAGGVPTVTRLSIGAEPAAPTTLYVLGTGPQLWRIDITLVAGVSTVAPATVGPLPAQLFGVLGDQSDYDNAVTIDPANANRVIVGGAAALSPHDNSWSAAMYRLTIGGASPAYNSDYVAGEAADPTWIGAEVHADVHKIHWQQVGGASQVWVCCDGGIFRSTAGANSGSFVSRATGLAVTEPGFVANHQLSDGIIITGVQDNGTQLRIGETVWRRALGAGDGGGVAFDPGATGRFVAQTTNDRWDDDGEQGIGPITRAGDPAADNLGTENTDSRFYSNPAVIRRADGVTQLAVGTTRVWYSERWGRSRWDGVAGVFRRSWVTLPSGTDPRAGNAAVNATDVLAPGPQPTGSADPAPGVRALRWGTPDKLYVLMRGAIHRIDRNTATGTWIHSPIHIRPAPPAVAAPLAWPVAGPSLPDTGALNDLAVHDPAAGNPNPLNADGSFYVATSHPLEPVWWYDGAGAWHPARLGTTDPPAPPVPATVAMPADGVRAPAYSVVVDPDNRNIVYAGTTVGVWRGVLTPGPTPTWSWAAFNMGLPEAAVQDLAIGSWPRPAGGALKLLRAAVQARGVWEVEPDAVLPPTTFLRVHPFDTRRITPTDLRDPMWNASRPELEWPLDWADRRNRDFRNGAGQPRATPDGTPVGSYHWHGSPDIRLRPARATTPVPPPPDLPWGGLPANRFWLWSLQTALRTIDPQIVPDGRWTAWWRARLRAARVTLGVDAAAPGQARVTAALWNNAQVQAGFWADPWADGGPTEVDLVERVVGLPTPRTGGPNGAATSPASLAVMRRPYRVDVCLHYRGRLPLAAGSVAVILLRLQLPPNAAGWAALAPVTTPAEPALAALRAALDALPAGGGAVPAELALPASWGAADAGVSIRRPAAPLAPGAPAIVTFDVDFSADAAGTRWLLIALVHSTADPLLLTGADLRAAILGSRHAAARSVQVV